jgi:mono/diheme cytochrome c family protein
VLGALALGAVLTVGLAQSARADCGYTKGDPEAGSAIYHQTCIACHGPKGHGVIPGAPDFTKKGGVLSEPHALMEKHIKNGFQKPGDPMAMPPRGGNPGLTDQDIDNVHAYLHKHFGCG